VEVPVRHRAALLEALESYHRRHPLLL